MKRILLLAPTILLLGTLAAPMLQAQAPAGPGKGQGQHLRKRDGSCATPSQGRGQGRGQRGQGVRKQDGTGPRAGTVDCPKTPKAPAK
jgi:ABC-type microcin C transport system permease subunit YejB